MLTIKKVPTLVSNYQDDDTSQQFYGTGGGCGLAVSSVPLYAFKNRDESNWTERTNIGISTPSMFLHNLLLSEWEDRSNRGFFRYDVAAYQTRVIPGRLGFIAQLNQGRHLNKRPTEFRIYQVLQPFDDSKFNFTKVGQEEVLFRFEEAGDDVDGTRFLPSAAVLGDHSPSVVAINVSPIEYGHVLLIPRVLDHLPQRIDHESFFLAMKLAQEANDRFFRVGYNSLGAFATINHLHFQAYYLPLSFPVEKAQSHRVKTLKSGLCHDRGVIMSCLSDYPVRGFVFSGGRTIRDLSEAISCSCIWLQNNNVPFNVLIADAGNRVFLFPQCYAEKQARGEVSEKLLETQVNPAVWEISGHMVLKRRKDYENASESSVSQLLAQVSLSKERFDETKRCVLEAIGTKQEVCSIYRHCSCGSDDDVASLVEEYMVLQ